MEVFRKRLISKVINEHVEKHYGKILTRQQREICKLLVKGYINLEISLKLGLNIKTIKFHNSRIFKRLDIKNKYLLIYRVLDDILKIKSGSYERDKRHFAFMKKLNSKLSLTLSSLVPLFYEGLSIKQIAHIKGISEFTVKSHKFLISKKLGLDKSRISLSLFMFNELLPIYLKTYCSKDNVKLKNSDGILILPRGIITVGEVYGCI